MTLDRSGHDDITKSAEDGRLEGRSTVRRGLR